MSLFPAYDRKNDEENDKKEEAAGPSWLSYPCEALSKQKESSSFEDIEAALSSSDQKKRKQKKTKRIKDGKKSKRHEENENNLYVLDDGISKRPIIKQVTLTKPIYRGNNVQITKKRRKKKKKDRYFSEKNSIDEAVSDLSVESSISIEEFVKRTEEFNKRLRNEPNNIGLWIDYVNLQDLVAGTKIGRAEKKLSILDKALLENGDSEILLNERMTIYETVYPFEKVSSEAKSLLTRFPRNPVGWRWIIQATQFSLSKMTAPGVLQAYEHVLEGLHRSRQHNTQVFLNILLQCMLFLRQAGLWEQLWLLSELYLELTYTSAGSGAFKINVAIPEEEIQSLEDAVLTSGLTLGALWLRTEHLRECVHFAPVQESPDPQRTVFVDDLSGILFPLGSYTYSRLMCLALISFKVPPLPMTDAFYEYVGLKNISWSLDNVEVILSGCSANIGITPTDSNFLKPCNDLLVGPQYLNRDKIGAKEFFESVDSLFNCCINNCAEEDIASILAWRVRWWCFVIQHSSYKEGKYDINKELESRGKALLKKHRQCLPLFTEYAICEAHIGNFSVSLKILETAISLQQPPLIAGRDRRDICSMYKSLVEILLRNDFIANKEKVLKVLIAMSFGEPIKNIIVTEDLTQKALERMSHITTEIIREFETNDKMSEDVTSLKEVALTHEIVSWLSCHAWFLYIAKDVWQSCASLEKAIQALESLVNNDLTIGRCILEDLFQTLLSIMYHFCSTNLTQFHVLQEMIDRAVKHFPNNTYFLHLLASTKISSVKWQKIVSNITSTKSSLACLLLIFILRHKLFSEEEQQLISKENAHKRIANLLKKLTKENFSERNPLIWRLMLQSTSNLSLEETKNTFFLALEKCPWVKMLYYEAAKMLPEYLPQIQDLLVEKELRLHITPEELEILREDPPKEESNLTSNFIMDETNSCIEKDSQNAIKDQTKRAIIYQHYRRFRMIKNMIRRSMTSFSVMAKINPVQEASLKESCILVNNQDQVIGNASKRDCHLVAPDGNILLHRAFSLFLFNTKGELLLQKRSDTKITFPGHFTNTCCSHPLFDFEEELQEENAVGVKLAARRRLSHELGVPKDLVTLDDFSYLTRILYKSEGDGIWGEHEVDYILIMYKDLPINPNPEEVSEVCYIGKDKFNEFIKNIRAPITPWFKLVVQNKLGIWWNNLHQLHNFQDHVNIHTFV